jgi:hypothetical protein
MKPERSDIAVPPFAPNLTWIGGEPPAAERLTARGPLLVHFFELGELSGVQTLPALEKWAGSYGEAGLTVLGVHSPRNDLARSDAALAAGLGRLGVSFPVANDREYRVWHAYGCKGWPSLFLWGRGGNLTWFHLGLGSYVETEEQIRGELRGEDEEAELPEPAGVVTAPVDELARPSEEVFPGGSHERPWRGAPGEPLEVEYAAGGSYASLDGEGTVSVAVDGEAAGSFEVEAPGLYELALHDRHGVHEVRLDLDPGVRVWSIGFAPGRR